jgi:hypothetical protein
LPVVDREHDFTLTRRHGNTRGPAFYLDALRYAQSHWCAGRPAQALLQLNKAWMADLWETPHVLESQPSPYQAMIWIVAKSADGSHGFLGNPVRHFQHLASRMTGPRAAVRSWRAWLCMHLAERRLAGGNFPRDGRQLAREGLFVPSLACSLAQIASHGWPGEAPQARSALGDLPTNA